MSTPSAGKPWLRWGWGSGLCPVQPLCWSSLDPLPRMAVSIHPALKAPLALQEVAGGPQEGQHRELPLSEAVQEV